MIKLSICVLIYNSIEYIEECINSLVNQTDKNFEIVLINNASEDGSVVLASQILEKNNFKNYKIVNIDVNTGCGQGRTIGYRNATYEYIKNLDSDDTLPNYFVEKINKVLENDSPDIITYSYNKVNSDGEIVRCGKPFKNDLYNKYYLTMFWNYTFKKELAIKANVDTCGLHYCEDRVFSLLLMPYVKKISVIEDVMYFYKVNSKSTTNSGKRKELDEAHKLVYDAYSIVYEKANKKEKKFAYFFLMKFYVGVLGRRYYYSKTEFSEIADLEKAMVLKVINKKRLKAFFIIPTVTFNKELLKVQIGSILIKMRLFWLLRKIGKRVR